MKTTILLLTNALLAFAGDANLDTASAFSRLKSLAGEWEGSNSMGKTRVVYTVIAGGTSVVEREISDHMPEMLTVYHMDGKRLLLTHYCMAGNQPRMEARAYNPSTGELQFRFLDATNLAKPGDGHMHNVNLRFIDDKHVAAEWQFYEDGKLKQAESGELTRVR
jgi:hypothetical protein